MRMKVKFFHTTRADRQIALLLFAIIFGLYLRTLAPGLLGGDSGEFQTAAWTLGLAHPTGYPLYLLLGTLWQHTLALFGLTPAHALNLLSALFGALAIAMLYLTLIHWLQSDPLIRRLAALLAALLLAVNPTFWSQSLVAEVYTLHALFVILLLHICYRLYDVRAATAADAPRLLLWLALLTGLALTHHATTILLLPLVAVAFWRARVHWAASPRMWLLLPLFVLAPLLLYLYVPLRSGAGPSPWYHQALGVETLTLYQNTWAGFWRFVSGQSIAVGFHTGGAAWAELPQAWLLWRLHFFLPGLLMVGLGLYVLWRMRNWRVLALTVPFFLLQQIFNLFYAIDDILAYYLPLYLVAAIWVGFTADTIGGGLANAERKSEAEQPEEERRPALAISLVLLLVLLWIPLTIARTYFPQLDQSAVTAARDRWDAIAAAAPSNGAILISNDRNEIVPLFYYQAVEGKLPGVTGLFPLIEPTVRFADIGATIDAALAAAGDAPIYLIKPMPGLESKFVLQPATPPLVAVEERVNVQPLQPVEQSYGPLQLLGFDWARAGDEITVTLYWQVNEPLPHKYTTTVQLLTASGEKIAQHDAPPGGDYYPTTLWKPGELLVESHPLVRQTEGDAATLLIAMYERETLQQLEPPIEIGLTDR